MLHNYVPSGNGRDNFIFNDDVFKYGRHGISSKLNPVSKVSHDNEFWVTSEKKCQKASKRLPIQFMKFPTEAKATVEDSRLYKKREEPKVSQISNERPVIAGYQGHVQNQKFVVGKPQHRVINDEEVQRQVSEVTVTTTTNERDYHRSKKFLPEEENQISLPSFQRMKMDVLKKRLNQISGELNNKDHIIVDALQCRLPVQQKQRNAENSLAKKYPSGYSGHVPRRYLQ